MTECVDAGVLVRNNGALEFRHELDRETAMTDIPARRLGQLHQLALNALCAGAVPGDVQARCAEHADAAGDTESLRLFAAAAAATAADAGSHAQAAVQYERALRGAARRPAAERAELSQRLGEHLRLIGRRPDSVTAFDRATRWWRIAGKPAKAAECLAWSGRATLGPRGHSDLGRSRIEEAVRILEPMGTSRELAAAYEMLAAAHLLAEADVAEALAWAHKARQMAQRSGDRRLEIRALVRIGTIKLSSGDADGLKVLADAYRAAKAAGIEEEAGRAASNLVYLAAQQRNPVVASRYVGEALTFYGHRELDHNHLNVISSQAFLLTLIGDWSGAESVATSLLGDSRPFAADFRSRALRVIGLVRMRRGDAFASTVLDDAVAANETSPIDDGPEILVARAEDAWLAGRVKLAAATARAGLAAAESSTELGTIGPAAFWLWRATGQRYHSHLVQDGFRLQIDGDWDAASRTWDRLGCPYEAACARADSDDEPTLQRALLELRALGAKPMARMVARKLRARGVRGVPRGPRETTLSHPAKLTMREVEILRLVAIGLRDAEIAARVQLSPKTVEHHVSSILTKLEVRNRTEAAYQARSWLAPS